MNENLVQHERLPVIAQLSVLFLILGGLFGTLVFLQDANTTKEELTATTPLKTEPLPPVTPTQNTLTNITVQGAAAFVWDVKSQKVLYEKNAEAVLPLASITKLMTTLLTYELFDPKERTNIPLAAILQDGDTGLFAGEQFKTGDLQRLALVSSSNDAAFALGATVGEALGDRDPTAQFVTGMNIRAEELGLDSLEFKNTTGLDLSVSEPGAVGSAKDVSLLMAYIVKNYPELLNPTTESATRVYNLDGAYHEIYNTNDLVGNIPNLIGSKTGFTDLAGGNLTIAFDAGLDRPIVITVLGSTREGRFNDVENLIKAVQASYNTQ